jgi:hypothetical protein
MADTNIRTQISRLSGAKSDLATAITAKGVTVPDTTTLDGYAALVEQIDTGVDTSDATATAGEILSGKTAYVDGCKVTGTMTNKGKITANLVPGQTYTIPEGYHSGEGTVTGVSYRKAISYTKTLASGSNDIASYVLPEADYAISVFVKPYSYKSTATIGILCSELDKKADDGTLSYTNWDAGNGILNQTAEGTKLNSIHLYAGTDDMPSIKVTATASAEVLAEVGVYISRVGGNAALTVNGTDTSDATATAANILSGKTAYVDGAKLTGTMTNNGAVAKTMTANGSYTIPAGYHNGSGKVTVNVSSSSGSSNNNVEAYAITNTNPSVSFKRTDGAIKIWGYGTMTSSGGWGQQTTSLVAFEGDKYHKGAIYGSPSSTSLSLSISNGKLTGLPSGLTAINAIVTRGI